MPGRAAPTYTLSVPGFTRAVKVLILSTCGVYLLQFFGFMPALMGRLPLVPALVVKRFYVWQLVSYLFLHANLSHLFWNMFALWMFGVWAEEALGSTRFYQLYFVCGIGAGVVTCVVNYWLRPAPAAFIPVIGASGAIYGVLLAVALMFPNREVFMILPPVAIKIKWLVAIYGSIEFLATFHQGSGDSVSHITHLGGMLFAFLFVKGRIPAFQVQAGLDRWRRRRMQRRFEVYMSKRDRRNPPGGWLH